MARTKTKKPTYQELVRQTIELKAQLAHVYSFATREIGKASTDHMMASGVLLQLTALGGREIIQPVVIRDGLSLETIEALRKDLVRGDGAATAYKP